MEDKRGINKAVTGKYKQPTHQSVTDTRDEPSGKSNTRTASLKGIHGKENCICIVFETLNERKNINKTIKEKRKKHAIRYESVEDKHGSQIYT